MKAEIIKIGNSKGIRIPSAILKQCRIVKEVNLTVEDHTLIITPSQEVRLGWGNSFKQMAHNNDDQLIDNEDINNSWDQEDWQW
jgi:antitoxin MazE